MTVVVGYSEETMLCVSGTRQVTVTGRCCECMNEMKCGSYRGRSENVESVTW